MSWSQKLNVVGGVVFGTVLAFAAMLAELPQPAIWCAFTAGVCAAWWMTEAIPLPATALLPFIVFPLTGVLDHKAVASGYGHTAILLLMGGFFLSKAMERSGVHRRLAILLLRFVGGDDARRLVLGFMLATALLSMWVSNTATTLMMLPIALAILMQTDSGRLRTAILLGVAYASSIGGMATPVGTPPNVLFIANYFEQTGRTIGFIEWGRVAFPIVILLFPIVWLVLTHKLRLDTPITMPEIGNWRSAEKRVLAVFVVTALAWIFRESPAGGWTGLIGAVNDSGKATVGDSTIALAASLALFLIPSGEKKSAGDGGGTVHSPALLDWHAALEIPWGILLLFGGGLALADGFSASGLSAAIGDRLALLSPLHPLLIVLIVCTLVNFLTELTSSTATTALLLPILAETARAAELPLELVMLPGTIAASCAFMLPIATAPNTIVFSAGGISSSEMARTGFWLNLLSTIVISLVAWWFLA